MYASFDGHDTNSRGPQRRRPAASPLVICDRLLALAQDADRAGLPIMAEHLLFLAHTMFDPEAA